ncbi:class I SAM-dependent methyltransferase [Priestia aryabhattai]|uniref:class I SAM-dependent methyltransferase n=1 Tax=Priestia aryabhattai TaxID=412384 RepID=UPI003D2C1FB0
MSNKEMVVSQFGGNAGKYVKSKGHAKGKDLAVLAEIAEENRGGKLLDVATGGGHVANKLAPVFQEVTAFDLTPQMLQSAEGFIKENGYENVSFVQGDAEDMPFQDDEFDTVTCRIAPHHFPNVKQFIKEVYRVLKPGGQFLLIDNVAPEVNAYDEFYNRVEKTRDPSHYRAYKKTEWLSMLEMQGFRTEVLTTFPKRFLFDDWCGMMNVPEETKRELTQYMLNIPSGFKQFFDIKTNQQGIESFQGEAIFVACYKNK